MKDKHYRSFRPLRQAWDWLINPVVALPPAELRMARVLIMFQALLVLLGGLFQGIYALSYPEIGGFGQIFVGLLVLIPAYWLAKTGRVKISAIMTVAVVFGLIFANELVQPEWPDNLGFLMFAILPVIISNLFFSNRTVAAIAGLQILLILSLPLLISTLGFWELINGPVSFLVIATALLLVTNHYRHLVEADRQAVLADSEERFRQMAETIQDVFWTYDRKTDKVLYVSPAYERVLDQDCKTFYEYPFSVLEMVHPDDRQLVSETLQAIEHGKPVSFEGRVIWKDGSQHWAWIRGFQIFDQRGEVTRMAGLITDVTESKLAEQRLKKHEGFLQSIINSSPGYIVTIDLHGYFLYANRRWSGRSEDELRTINFFDLVPANQREAVQDVFQTVIQTRVVLKGESLMLDEDGQYRWMEAFFSPVIVDDEVVQVTVFISDIHERKQAEQILAESEKALRQSEKKYRELAAKLEKRVQERTAELQDLYDNAPCGYHSLDRNGAFVMINQTELNWLGYTREEVIGKLNIRDILAPEGQKQFDDEFPLFIERGWTKDSEIDFVRKDGSRMPVILNALAVRDTQGNFVNDRVTVFDITERRVSEVILERQNNNLVSLYNITLSLFQQTEMEAMLQVILDETVRLLNVPHVEISLLEQENTLVVRAATPKVQHMLGSIAERGQSAFLSWEAVETGRPVLHENYTTHPSRMDSYTKLQLGATAQIPIKLDRVIGILSIARDYPSVSFSPEEIGIASLLAQLAAVAIQSTQLYGKVTDELIKRRQIEEALLQNRDELSAANAALEKAARLKDEFLASMSHELRTPLTGILGLSEALQLQTYGSLSEKQLKALRDIEGSGRHLLELINDILDLSKIEAGKFELQLEPCALSEICQASLQLTKGMAHQRRQNVSFSINPMTIMVRADARRLKQMLVNLLGNAIKFTPEGGVLGLEVNANEAEKIVRLSVWDHGMGIKPEDLAVLFKPFVQLDNSLSRRHSGTGLGLSLVQRMAELHGGSIQVESIPGTGSRFTILLPWEAGIMLPRPANSRLIAGLRRALVVEDRSLDAELASRLLQNLGISSLVQATALGVVEKTMELQPGVILLDLNLNGQSGFEVLTALKGNEATRQIPVVIMSIEEQRAEANALGAAGYLVKPFTQDELRIELERAVAALPRIEKPVENLRPVSGPRILLADDNEIVLETLSDFLTSQNYRVVSARNGKELVKLAGEVEPEMILTDIQMPGSDGLEAIRQIRAHLDPKVAKVPIIAITALAMPGDRERCLAAGANDYLSKPLGLDDLVGHLQRLLSA